MKTRNFILTLAIACSVLWLSACTDQSEEILPDAQKQLEAETVVDGQEIDRD